jgi:general secretion pathway protein G
LARKFEMVVRGWKFNSTGLPKASWIAYNVQMITAAKTIKSRTSRVRGFTLVEILIVLALIGIVAGLAMSNLGEIFGGGKVKAAQTWVNSTGEAYVTSYFALVGEYPKSINDLKTPPSGIPPFVKRSSDLEDPWGKPYVYLYPGAQNTGSF